MLGLEAPSIAHFFLLVSGRPRALHSFPTRRSSDLTPSGRPPASNWLSGDAASARRSSDSRGAAIRQPSPTTASDRKSTRLNSSHGSISYAVFCLKKKTRLLLARRAVSDHSFLDQGF